MTWKFAVHTISWGDRPLEEILRDAGNAGYAGVELFQHPSELGGVESIVEAFDRSDVQLVGVAAGSFAERCHLVRQIAGLRGVTLDDPSLPYIYCDEWRDEDSQFKDAVSEGLRIGLHPHMYKPVQTFQEAAAILKANPKVGFLPDTAHLMVAGESPASVIKELAAFLVGVHLKSWREDVGRSYHFYARGFCELGEGDVNVEAVLDVLNEASFHGWLIVELDSTSQPMESAKRSLEWLRKFEPQRRGVGGHT